MTSDTLSYRDLITAFRRLGLGRASRVLAHVSLPALGPIAGGAETVVGALLSTCETVVMPAFTLRCMVTPPFGPADNGLDYAMGEVDNARAEFFMPDVPVDQAVGPAAEVLRQRPNARRSMHPLISFTGVNAEEALEAQTLQEPLAPVGWLGDFDGDVLLLGADHIANVALHHAARLAGRKQFVRWALTPEGVVECPDTPACSDGFPAIASRLEGVVRRAALGRTEIEAIPLRDLINLTVGWIRQDPRALLCDRETCSPCRAVRAAVRVGS